MPSADASGARLYYEVHGEGQPLLLIPGFGSTVEIYVANAPALAERFRVIVFDPRGAGRSDVPQPATSYSMQQFAEDCAAVLDAAGAESAHVFGTSFGGMVAQHLALLYPERVRRMVLGCTTPGGVAHVTPPPEQIATFLAASGIADPAAAVRSTYPLHYSDAFIAGHDEEIVARSQRNAHLRSTPEGRAGQLNAVSGHDTWERLPELRAPVFVAHGEEDGVVPVQNARNLASQIPGARLKIYPQAKHIFFIECADELNDDIAAVFTENEGYSRAFESTRQDSNPWPGASKPGRGKRRPYRSTGLNVRLHRALPRGGVRVIFSATTVERGVMMPTARVNDIDIYYEQHGDPQDQPVLLIMGFGMNAAAWGAQIPALAEQYHVTAFDNRGAGRSSQPDGPYSMQQFVADTAGLLDMLGIESAHIVGASMGGMIAQHFALAHPQRVRSLVLMCTTPGGPHSAGYAEMAERGEEAFAIEDIAALLTPERARDFALELFTPEFLAHPGAGFAHMAGSTMQYPSTPAGMKGQMHAILGHDTFDRLPEITAPTLVLAGDADPMVLPENSRILASRIPRAELELFPALRHGFNAEQPDRVNRIVLDFLARHATQPVGSAADA